MTLEPREAPPEAGAGWGAGAAILPDRATWAWTLAPFAATRVAIGLVGWLAPRLAPHGRFFGEPHRALDLFLRWDAGWFLSIVRHGYRYAPGHESNVAFFPLYPLVVAAVATLGVPAELAGVVLSNLALYVAAAVACEVWGRDHRSTGVGRTTALLLLVWPASFFASTVYSDALFLALLALVTAAGRARRWRAAGLLGFLLALTRGAGVLVVAPLLVEAWGARSDRTPSKGPRVADLAWLACIPLGPTLYAAYQWRAFGDPLAFAHVQAAWGRDMGGIAVAFRRAWYHEPFYRVLFLGSTLYLLAVVAAMLARKVRPSDTLWCAIVWLTSTTSGLLEAFPRLSMMALPMFGAVAWWLDGRPRTRLAVLATSAALLALLTALFTSGYWMT